MIIPENGKGLAFEVRTPSWKRIRSTTSHWEYILNFKHPDIKERLQDVVQSLTNPDEIRLSRVDPNIHLYYRSIRLDRWIVAVIKILNGEGFLVTAYITGNIKEGNSNGENKSLSRSDRQYAYCLVW